MREADSFTQEEIARFEAEIDAMDRVSMARLWRFAPSGHPFFRKDLPRLSERFSSRFKTLGGFSPEISKSIG